MPPDPTLQTHGFMDGSMGYYISRYSTSGYIILWFFVCTLRCYPPLTLKKRNGFSHSLFVRHLLSCSHVGLDIARHNEVQGGLLYLFLLAFPSNSLRGKPLIRQGRSRSEEEVRQGGRGLDTRGGVLIRGLW